MGLFSSLFRKRFADLKARADRYYEQGQYGLARSEYLAAQKRFDPQTDESAAKSQLEARLADATLRLGRLNLEEGLQLLQSDQGELALAALRTAVELLAATPQADEAQQALAKAEQHLFAEAESPQGPSPFDTAARADDDEQEEDGDAESIAAADDTPWQRLLHALPGERAAAYRALGADFADGCVRLHEGDGAAAVAALRRAQAGHPDDPFVLLELGQALLFQNEGAEAASCLERYHERHPDDTEATYLLAEALRAAGRGTEASQILEAEVEQQPKSVRNRLALAEHHIALSEFENAVRAASEALDLIDLTPAIRRASSWSRAGSAQASLAAAASEGNATERLPPRIVLFRTLGQALFGAKRFDEAIGPLERALKEHWRYDPDSGTIDFDRESAWLLAHIYVDLNRRIDRAIELLHALDHMARAAEQLAVLTLLGQAYQRRGDADQARQHWQRVRDQLPPDQTEGRQKIDALLATLDAPAAAD